MGRKSTKENKNIYQLSREESALTRDAAAEALGFISADRIEKIENLDLDNRLTRMEANLDWIRSAIEELRKK